MTASQRPDVEITRRRHDGSTIHYGHIYRRPLIVHVLGHTIIGRRHLQKMWADADALAGWPPSLSHKDDDDAR